MRLRRAASGLVWGAGVGAGLLACATTVAQGVPSPSDPAAGTRSGARLSFICGAALFTNLAQMQSPPRGQELLETAVAATYWVSEAHTDGLSPLEAVRLRAEVDRFNPAAVAALAQRCRADGLARFRELPDDEKALIVELAASSVGSGS